MPPLRGRKIGLYGRIGYSRSAWKLQSTRSAVRPPGPAYCPPSKLAKTAGDMRPDATRGLKNLIRG
jgi:hypothetical protein